MLTTFGGCLRLYCGDYYSDVLLMGAICRWQFIYMWRHLQAATNVDAELEAFLYWYCTSGLGNLFAITGSM